MKHKNIDNYISLNTPYPLGVGPQSFLEPILLLLINPSFSNGFVYLSLKRLGAISNNLITSPFLITPFLHISAKITYFNLINLKWYLLKIAIIVNFSIENILKKKKSSYRVIYM